MARKPNPQNAVIETAPLPEEQITESQNMMARIEDSLGVEERQAIALIGQRTGRRQVFHSLIKLLTCSDIQDLARIKESKQYKGLQVSRPDGNRSQISSWEEYCELVEGRSHKTIDLEIRNLEHLGPECFDTLRQAGIGASKMRDLRALPDEAADALAEAAKAGDKQTLLELAEDLIEKQRIEKAKAQREAEEARADAVAKDERISKLSDDLNREHEKVAKAKRAWKAASPDEKREMLEHAVVSGKMAILADLGGPDSGLRATIEELMTYCNENGMDCSQFLGNVFAEIFTGVHLVRDDERWPIAIPIVNDGE